MEHQPELAKALDHIANIFLFEDDSAFKHIIYVEGQGYQKLASTFAASPAQKWEHMLSITRQLRH